MARMTKYKFNEEIYESYEALEKAISDFAADTYDDFLDDCYEEVVVGGFAYPYSMVFRSVDEIAYRCGLSDYEDYLFQDVEEIEDDEDE